MKHEKKKHEKISLEKERGDEGKWDFFLVRESGERYPIGSYEDHQCVQLVENDCIAYLGFKGALFFAKILDENGVLSVKENHVIPMENKVDGFYAHGKYVLINLPDGDTQIVVPYKSGRNNAILDGNLGIKEIIRIEEIDPKEAGVTRVKKGDVLKITYLDKDNIERELGVALAPIYEMGATKPLRLRGSSVSPKVDVWVSYLRDERGRHDGSFCLDVSNADGSSHIVEIPGFYDKIPEWIRFGDNVLLKHDDGIIIYNLEYLSKGLRQEPTFLSKDFKIEEGRSGVLKIVNEKSGDTLLVTAPSVGYYIAKAKDSVAYNPEWKCYVYEDPAGHKMLFGGVGKFYDDIRVERPVTIKGELFEVAHTGFDGGNFTLMLRGEKKDGVVLKLDRVEMAILLHQPGDGPVEISRLFHQATAKMMGEKKNLGSSMRNMG